MSEQWTGDLRVVGRSGRHFLPRPVGFTEAKFVTIVLFKTTSPPPQHLYSSLPQSLAWKQTCWQAEKPRALPHIYRVAFRTEDGRVGPCEQRNRPLCQILKLALASSCKMQFWVQTIFCLWEREITPGSLFEFSFSCCFIGKTYLVCLAFYSPAVSVHCSPVPWSHWQTSGELFFSSRE